ncbi:MAG: hypothetical protein ACFB01_15280 [Cohaesibacteraceae bacterium]
MKLLQTLLLALTFGATASAAQADASSDPLVAMGAYVASDDMGQSEAFYMALFDREPVIRLDDFIAFDVSGGWFAIVSRPRYAAGSIPGNGPVPYIQSGDLEIIRARYGAASGGEAPAIIMEPGISILKVYDPEGQLVEFFALTGS